MTLTASTKIGPYEIQSLLGAGGMGEVYRARDGRLARTVALKVLPGTFSGDAERTGRFQREAQLLASLNHPNIASIYGLEDTNHVRALVMEFVEGPTIADRIACGAIPVDEALPIAKQICDGVEYAHEQGIVHRDLKPANIKLAADGTVKVLDFGLAKALQGDRTTSDISSSPTLTHMATQQGIILGTAAYMSPEQAKGKSVDRRADIWAFGCVLFEMLTGRMAFSGETLTDTLAAVVKEEPDWCLLPENTPLRISELLQRCLKKDARQRLQSIGDARIAIEEVVSGGLSDGVPQRVENRERRWQRVLPWALCVICAIVASVLAVAHFGHHEPAVPPLRLTIEPPSGTTLGSALALSPDGTRLVFVATSKGKQMLWMRPMDSVEAQPIPGTEGGDFPFWSPDGKSIGFFADDKLKRLDFASGSIQDLCGAGEPRGGTWSSDGTIVFAPSVNTPLMKIPASGGTPVPATDFDPARQERSHRWPYFLPDGRHFLFVQEGNAESPDAIDAGSLDSTRIQHLLTLPMGSAAIYSDNYLLYSKDGSLVAQRFDSKQIRIFGNPVRLAEDVSPVGIEGPTSYVSASVSHSGLLVYRTAASAISQLVLVDRSGKTLHTIGSPAAYDEPSLSPDQKRIAFSLPNADEAGSNTLWLMDVATGATTRFTFGGDDTGSSIWSPDGRWIYFTSGRNGQYNIYRKPTDGSADAERVLKAADTQRPNDISADGRFLLIEDFSSVTNRDLVYSTIPPIGEPKAFRATPADETDGRFSPDGRWVAYCSDENHPGDFEVFVSAFPPGGGRWQVSSGGGFWPTWSADGRELYFVSGTTLMVADIVPGSTFQFRPPRALFPVRLAQGVYSQSHSGYFALSGGQKFLVNELAGTADSPPITAITNWTSELKNR